MGKKNNDLTTINPALVPSAAFTVVPRTPAPEHINATALGGSAEVLSSSLLGRPAVPGPTHDDEPFSDPESSLYDYQVMEDAGYSSVEMLAISRQRRGTGRAPAGVPPGQEHDIYEHQQVQDLDSPTIQQNPEALYSMPLKRGQRVQSSNTMQTTQEVRDAMQQVHDLSSDEEAGPSNKPMRKSEKQNSARSARSLHFPVEHEVPVQEIIVHHSVSTPVQTPKTPKAHAHMVEDKIVKENMEPVRSSHNRYHSSSPGPLSARSGQQSARSVTMADDRMRSLEAEREHLTTLTHQLENEVQTYREVVSTYESGDSETAQSLLTKKQINDLKLENESLKSSIQRLNVELSAYQAKYRPVNDQQGNMMGMPSNGPPPSWLNINEDPHTDHPIIREFNIRYLNPLFLAYDDRIKEREETIRKCQSELEALQARCEAVVKENDRLHARLQQSGTGHVDYLEWEQMKENARLVLEENQNLLEQVSVKDQKTHDVHQAHLREVNKLCKSLVQVKAEKADLETEIEELRQSYKDIKQKYDKMVLQNQGLITQEQHIQEISELKQKLSDVTEQHRQEVDSINNKLHASQVERKTLGAQVLELTSENRRHQMEARLMHKSVRKAQQKMMFLQQAIEQSENKEMSVQEYMSSLIKVAEKSAFERDTYEKVAKEHEIESKKAMKRLLQGTITVGKMEEKLKLYKMKAAARISTVAERLKEQEEMFNLQKKEYEREIKHLRMLIKEKEDYIQEVIVEKRDIEEQMEAVWQSANSENVRIKDELKRNVTQLRKHPGLSEALDEQNRLNTIDISSDDNAVIKVTDD
ncbi:centrosomal protein of 89 kDa-like isoform X2 [Ruditapes philippinarum]|uniref:centrosomal protein of 89 kDa-like isoform X2 n=1 Tax=Ruditapes philippinarum TaxID=129788 RepID=UPI00295BBFB9|nr:centrosomal protein of 89 kDa-like isoform X2 [Ruditapes philippinarum]